MCLMNNNFDVWQIAADAHSARALKPLGALCNLRADSKLTLSLSTARRRGRARFLVRNSSPTTNRIESHTYLRVTLPAHYSTYHELHRRTTRCLQEKDGPKRKRTPSAARSNRAITARRGHLYCGPLSLGATAAQLVAAAAPKNLKMARARFGAKLGPLQILLLRGKRSACGPGAKHAHLHVFAAKSSKFWAHLD